jgi:predicted nucleotidyltransferase
LKDNAEFFFKDFMNGFVTTLGRLIKIKINDKKFEDILRDVPKIIASILASNIGNADLWESVKCLFDHKTRIY